MVLIVKSKLMLKKYKDETFSVELRDRFDNIIVTFPKVSKEPSDSNPYLWIRGHHLEVRTDQSHFLLTCEFDKFLTDEIFNNKKSVIEGNWNYSNIPSPIAYGR